MRLNALLEAWQRLSSRERLLAGLACGALLLVVLRYGVVAPYMAYTAQLEERTPARRAAPGKNAAATGPRR